MSNTHTLFGLFRRMPARTWLLAMLVLCLPGIGRSQNLTQADFTGVVVPQYMSSGTSTRLPVMYRATVSNLTPSTLYRFYTQGATNSTAGGGAVDINSTNPGAGNPLLISADASTYYYTSGPGFGSATTLPGNYSTFTTDANGSYTGWFGFVNTGNARFTPGNTVFPSIVLAKDATPGTVEKRLALDLGITVLALDGTAANATGLKGSSGASAKNLVAVYDNTAGTGRPLAITVVENIGVTIGSLATYYTTAAGNWNTLVPNALTNGVRRVEERSVATGAVLNCNTDADGVWPSGASTVNPSGGLTAIQLTATDAPLNAGCGTASPALTVAPATLTAFSTTTGTPSSAQTFTVSGSNLTASATVTAPAGYEVSLTMASGYAASVTVAQTGGTISSTTIYVRLTGTTAGTFAGNVMVTSTGATAQNVAVTGTVTAPAATPTITSFTPANGPVGTTVTITGTNFSSAATVSFNGTAAATVTFVSATQLTAVVPAGATTGPIAVTVGSNTATSATNFTVDPAPNPVPTVTSLSPAAAVAGSAAFTLTVTGTNFLSTSVVTFNGTALTTTFVSATQLTAAVPATAVATVGTFNVTVTNPAPGGGASAASPFAVVAPVPAGAVVISQVYGGGGNSGAPYTNDYVELFNRSNSSITLIGYYLQYASATGTFTNKAALPDLTIPAGGYYLVQLAGGTTGVALPTPDASPTSPNLLNLSGTNGKIALATSVTTVVDASSANVADYVGYGTANTYEGSAAAPALSNTTAALRAGNGCIDTNDNLADFTAVAPAPRNSATTLNPCAAPAPTIVAIGTLTSFATTTGTPSAAQSFTVSGSNLTAGLTVTAPAGYEVSLTMASGYAASVTVAQTGGTAASTPVYVRLTGTAAGTFAGNVTVASTGATTQNVAVTGTVTAPSAPTITTLAPATAVAGGATFTLTVTGTNFVNGAVVNFNGTALTTTFVSATQLTASVPASAIATAGTYNVTVTNPAPGSTSAAASFTVTVPAPTITSFTPANGPVGTTVTITGTNFSSAATVSFNGTAAATVTFVSATQLTAVVPTGATTGPIRVTVGGNTATSATNFTVDPAPNPVPTITALAPYSKPAGSAAFTLTVTGTNFLSTSVVTFNGTALTTTFVSATQLTAAVPATAVATVGTFNVTVTNPAPGGGTSAASPFAVTNGLFEDFELGTKSGYATGIVTLNSGDWTLTDALIAVGVAGGSDRYNGTKSARVRGGGLVAMNFDKPNGAGIVTINAALYGSDAASSFIVEISSDGGTTYADVTGTSPTLTTTLTPYTFTVNRAGNVRLRISSTNTTAGANPRINIDDISISNFTGTSAPTITAAPATLAPFTAPQNAPSAAQSYVLTTANLSAPVTVTAPAGFEVSLTAATGYASTVTLPVGGGTVYVRLAARPTVGSVSGSVTNVSGTASLNLTVTGTVVLGARNGQNLQLAVFPNPVQDVLRVEVAGRPATGLATLADLLGRTVLSQPLPATGQLNLSQLQPGTYLLTLESNGQKLTRKVVKE